MTFIRVSGLMLLSWFSASAQQVTIAPQTNGPALQIETPAGGVVTGHVVCQDTQRPARFARVFLSTVNGAEEGPRNGRRFGFRGGFGTTDADGNFRIGNVAPGDYYVQATVPGYLSERMMAQEEIAAGMSPQDVLSRLPLVHVDASGATAPTISLERGASLNGDIVWADGGPAVGVSVGVMPAKAPPQLPDQLQQMSDIGGGRFTMTDDRGHFRLTGIAPGDWILQLTAQGGASTPTGENLGVLRAYAPGVFRQSEATVFTLHRGDERGDVSIVLDLTHLHTVSGHVSVPGLNGQLGGFVQMSETTDRQVHANSSLQPDGSFAVPFVPAGNYVIAITARVSSGAAPGVPGRRGGGGGGTTEQLQPYSGTVVVTDTDIAGLNVTLTPKPPEGTAPGTETAP